MKKVTLTLYSFNELNEQAKKRAIGEFADINVSHNWWDSIYEDAKNIELEITGFDMAYKPSAKGKFIISAEATADEIFDEHGQETESYNLASEFKAAMANVNTGEEDDNSEDLRDEFLNKLLAYYANMLKQDCEYLQSEQAIKETIEANEYTFEEDGTMNNTPPDAEQEKVFPNGFASWQETHFEVVQAITTTFSRDELLEGIVFERHRAQGHGGLYELAEELTDKFEEKNKGREWDGEFFDEIAEFLEQEGI